MGIFLGGKELETKHRGRDRDKGQSGGAERAHGKRQKGQVETGQADG